MRALTRRRASPLEDDFRTKTGPPLGTSGHLCNCTFMRMWPGLTWVSEGPLLPTSTPWTRGPALGVRAAHAQPPPIAGPSPSLSFPLKPVGLCAQLRVQGRGVQAQGWLWPGWRAQGPGASLRTGGRRPSSVIFPRREVWKGFRETSDTLDCEPAQPESVVRLRPETLPGPQSTLGESLLSLLGGRAEAWTQGRARSL